MVPCSDGKSSFPDPLIRPCLGHCVNRNPKINKGSAGKSSLLVNSTWHGNVGLSGWVDRKGIFHPHSLAKIRFQSPQGESQVLYSPWDTFPGLHPVPSFKFSAFASLTTLCTRISRDSCKNADAYSVGLRCGLRLHISIKFPDVAGLQGPHCEYPECGYFPFIPKTCLVLLLVS